MEDVTVSLPEELARALRAEGARRGCSVGDALLAVAAEYFANDPRGRESAWGHALRSTLDLPIGAEPEELLLAGWPEEATVDTPEEEQDEEAAFRRWMEEYQLDEMDEL